jgi:hypothetical protein
MTLRDHNLRESMTSTARGGLILPFGGVEEKQKWKKNCFDM